MKLLALAAVSALSLTTAAPAAPILIDDFTTVQRSVDSTADGVASSTTEQYTLGGNSFRRLLTVDQIAHASADPNLRSIAKAGYGTLKLSNDSQTNAVFNLEYDIDSLTDDVLGNSGLTLDVLFTDAAASSSFTIAGYLNDVLLGSGSFTGPGTLSLSLPSLAAAGNSLRLMFTGGTAYDAELGPISLQVARTKVPEPAALGLLGLGVLAIGMARRRKTRA